MSDAGPKGPRFRMTALGRTVWLVGGGGLLFLIAWFNFTVYVRPNEFAIRQITVGGDKGIRPEVLSSGLHWVTPGTERLHIFPTDLQILNLTNDASERLMSDDGTRANALNIQTSEGYQVTVDVSVLYRVADPYKVMTTAGPGRLFESAIVVPRSEQVLRKRLGELDAEDFYDVTKRLAKARLAHDELNHELEQAGIHIDHVLVRSYQYDDRYQQAIEQRKIQDQTVFRNQAEAELAKANAERDRVVAEGEASVRVELARGDAEKRKLEAEAELYERTQRSAGEKATRFAEAEGTRLEAAALQGTGSEYMVGLQMADVLAGTELVVLPSDGESGTNPLDLKSALKRFDVTP